LYSCPLFGSVWLKVNDKKFVSKGKEVFENRKMDNEKFVEETAPILTEGGQTVLLEVFILSSVDCNPSAVSSPDPASREHSPL
jgi:hypothetical protein